MAAGVGEIRSREVRAERTLAAKYLVACDGAGSQTRRNAGIEMVGPA